MKMPKEKFDKRICWIIGNIILLMIVCIAILAPPSTGQSNKYNATILDYTVDHEMYENCTNKNFTQFCRQVGACQAGTHILCMYYKTGMIMGPQCEEGKMFKMSPELKNTIIEEISRLRDEVSEGSARGMDDVILPRAYSLKRRLKWDYNLSFVAQVWANQCQQSLDFCRSTLRFENPEQFVGIDTFTHPDWKSTSRSEKIKEMEKHCLTSSKVKEAVQSIIRLLKEGGRVHTTEAMIKNYTGGPRNTYLNMLYHNTTHIGCGMSQYLGYQRLQGPLKHDVFILQLVCNLSHRPIVGQMIYNTTMPEDYSATTVPTELSTTLSTTTPKEYPPMRDLVRGGRGPGVLIMPIITVEDAPRALVENRNLALRRSSGSIAQSNYNSFVNNNQQTKIAPYSRKASVFARAPIFNLSPRNLDNTSKANFEEKISLKKQLKTLLDQVPKREIPRLRELLKQMVKKHNTEENHTPRLGPVDIDTMASNTHKLVPEQLNRVPSTLNHLPPNIVNDEADEDYLPLTNSKFKEITDGSRFIGSDVVNFPSNTDIAISEDAYVAFDTQSGFEIPTIRKQKPIVHVKEKDKPQNNVKDNALVRGYSPAHKLGNNDLAIIDHIQPKPSQDQPNIKNDAERQQIIYTAGNKMNDHTQIVPDTSKLKRRLHLENEISKLKRKLQNLRQYIHKNDDVDDNARIRPVVTSQSSQRNTKYDERKNFYMPDRAHPLHEY